MGLTRTVRVVGYIKTDQNGSECDFEFDAVVPVLRTGDALQAHLEDDAREAAFERMEWGFEVKEIEK